MHFCYATSLFSLLMTNAAIWQACVRYLRNSVAPQDFIAYVQTARLLGLDETVMTVGVTNKYMHKFWTEHSTALQKHINHHFADAPTITINSVSTATKASATTDGGKENTKHNWFRQVSLDALQTFDTFVCGKQNQLAYAASQRVVQSGATIGNPLLLYGPSGLGKTHLLHAIVNQIAQSKRKRIAFINSELFVQQFVHCIRHRKMEDFKSFFRSLDVLLIDDIQFFAGKDDTQSEFFHTYNSLIDSKKQIVLTCDRFPSDIEGLEKRLITRLGSGLPIVIDPPSFETRVAILISKAQQMGHEIQQECAELIAQKIKSNVRDLEGALKLVLVTSDFMQQPITIDLVQHALRDLFEQNNRKITPQNIKHSVAEYYKIRMADLASKQRTKLIARARQMAMYLCKELTDLSLADIGRDFGNRDHATVLYSINKTKEAIAASADVAVDYKNLSRLVLANN